MGLVKTTEEAMEIFKKYGLQAEQIEPQVFKVLNTDKEVDIDEIQEELESCILIISSDTNYRRLDGGVSDVVSKVYYIVTDKHMSNVGKKYKQLAKNEYGSVLYEAYEYRPNHENAIDTIYAAEELGE